MKPLFRQRLYCSAIISSIGKLYIREYTALIPNAKTAFRRAIDSIQKVSLHEKRVQLVIMASKLHDTFMKIDYKGYAKLSSISRAEILFVEMIEFTDNKDQLSIIARSIVNQDVADYGEIALNRIRRYLDLMS